MTGFNHNEQTAYDMLRAGGVEKPTWEQVYELIHRELGGPSLDQVREKARAVVLAGMTPPPARSRNERRSEGGASMTKHNAGIDRDVLAIIRGRASVLRARHVAERTSLTDADTMRSLQRLKRRGAVDYDHGAGWFIAGHLLTKTHPLDLDQQLAALKAMPGYQNIVECLRVDRGSWAGDEYDSDRLAKCGAPLDGEDYPGEARERREAYDAILALLGEAVST